MRASAVATVWVLFLVPSLAATPLVSIHGVLRPSEAFEAVGAILPGPETSVRSADARLAPDAALAGLVLVEAEEARILLQQFPDQEAPAATFPNEYRGVPLNRPQLRHNLTLQLVGPISPPQVFVEAGASVARPIPLLAAGAACRLDLPRDEPPGEFPADADRTGTTTVVPLSAGPDRLVGTCHVDQFSARNTTRIRIYGLELWLNSTGTDPARIETGTFLQRDASGLLERKVTQVLLVDFNRGRIDFSLRRAAEVRLYAPEFTVAGTLGTGPAQGNLTWGDRTQTGRVDPFSTPGEFRLARATADEVALQGLAAEGPPWPAPGARLASPRGVGLGAGAAAVVAAAAAGAYLLFLLFSKLAPDRVLAHPRRLEILDFVRQEPGVHTNTVARTFGMRWANALHHVTVLRVAGHLTVRRVGGRTALFPTKSGYYGREEQVALLRRSTLRRIHEALREHPGLDQVALAGRLRLSQSRVSRSLDQLERVGLVCSRRDGPRLRYFLADAAGLGR